MKLSLMSLNSIRYAGNTLLLIGQYFILYQDMNIGILIKLLGGGLITTIMIKLKWWDMVIVLIAFSLLDFSRLITLLF